MKTPYILLIGLFVITSCNSPEQKDNNIQTSQNESDTNDIHNEISNQWVLIKRKSLKRDTTVSFSATPPSEITEFKISGFFSISDLIKIDTDQGRTQKLESRITGQWELNDHRLFMRYGTGDTTKLISFEIMKLDKENLTLKNIENNYINTYTKRK